MYNKTPFLTFGVVSLVWTNTKVFSGSPSISTPPSTSSLLKVRRTGSYL